MASAVIPPRQLAPTVGPAATLAGVHIRTGNLLPSGERVVSGQMAYFGNLRFFVDNAGCVSNSSGALPLNGCIIVFGDFEVYVATTRHRAFPDDVHVAADPPAHFAARGRRNDRPASCEVMCLAPGETGTAADGVEADPEEMPHRSKPPCERPQNRASTSRVAPTPSLFTPPSRSWLCQWIPVLILR